MHFSFHLNIPQYAGFTTHSATSGLGEKGQFSHLGSTSINISHCIYMYHTFPLRIGTMPPSKAHTSPKPRVHSDHYCVDALRIIAHTKAHALKCAFAALFAVISRFTQNHTVMQYTGSGYVDFFPTMHCGNWPLLACHWWHYRLWIHRIISML